MSSKDKGKKHKLFDLPKAPAKEDQANVKAISKVLKETPLEPPPGSLLKEKYHDPHSEEDAGQDPRDKTRGTPADPDPSRAPSSGRVVLYVGEDNETRPATVIRVVKDGEDVLVNLFIYLDHTPADHAEKSIRHLVPYSEEPKPETWHWPEIT